TTVCLIADQSNDDRSARSGARDGRGVHRGDLRDRNNLLHCVPHRGDHHDGVRPCVPEHYRTPLPSC
ncbi:hypothetical protein PFISCL1PPCAC_743, partial [Pristionchus fissidentatus]